MRMKWSAHCILSISFTFCGIQPRGLGSTSWILPHLYTIDLELHVSNPFDDKLMFVFWTKPADSGIETMTLRILYCLSFTQKPIWEPWRSLGNLFLPSSSPGLKTFQKMNKCVLFLLSNLDYLVNLIVTLPRKNIYFFRSLYWSSLLCMRSNLNFPSLNFHIPIIHSRRSSKSHLWFAWFNMYCGDFVLPLVI